jgi:hypothetical protein
MGAVVVGSVHRASEGRRLGTGTSPATQAVTPWGALPRQWGMATDQYGSVADSLAQFGTMTAFERLAAAHSPEFRSRWNECQLLPEAVIRPVYFGQI